MSDFALSIDNLRGLRQIRWRPKGVCVLIGANGAGKSTILLALKLLADASHSPLSEVLSLWRVPAWEELLVLAAIAALWVAMLLLSAVVSACLRVLKNTGFPLFFAIYSSTTLLFEAPPPKKGHS